LGKEERGVGGGGVVNPARPWPRCENKENDQREITHRGEEVSAGIGGGVEIPAMEEKKGAFHRLRLRGKELSTRSRKNPT